MTDLFELSAAWQTSELWLDAIHEYRGGNPRPLADLLRAGPCPADLCATLADAVSAPVRRARNADKRRLTITQRREMVRQWKDAQRFLARLRGIAQNNELGLEPSEVLQRVSELREQLLHDVSERFGVGASTVVKATEPTRGR